MARGDGGWHCMFTNSCIFETVSAPTRVPGTHIVCCGPHAQQMRAERFQQGRESSETMARMTPIAQPAGRGFSL